MFIFREDNELNCYRAMTGKNKNIRLSIIYLSLIGLFSKPVIANEWQEQKIQQALFEMYNLNNVAAHQHFKEVLNSQPFHPLAPMAEVATDWLKNQEELGYKEGNRILAARIDSVLAIYRDKLKADSRNGELEFYYGCTYGLKARLSLGEKDYLGVLINGYNAVRYIKAAERHQPDFIELQIPFGVFNYYVGISRGYMQIASWIMNTSGSKEDGLAQMSYAAHNARYSCYEARSILAMVTLYFEGDYESTLYNAEMMASDFPNNPYYNYLAGEALIQMGRYADAEKQIKRIQQLLPKLKPKTQQEYWSKLHQLQGSLALKKGDLATAEKELRAVIDNYDQEMDVQLGFALLRLGNVYDLTGRRELAIQCYRRASGLKNRSQACKLAELYLKTPYTQ
ncbi:MAG TPA: tetratricopeptide repeat protein [Candidatus Marinimicrobia bacterium]|nr:tetratricopeptide repeat protein [Candidatus Neomarinimicrobiota bacterium]HRS51726.1 tetratricopeptide repeat protein [Candidatus Neomarinimicrobiota bacterium]HRU92124.1 tetratricopeptide repeat protein [Candidatus Neomarinimicrobiota bacterium]